MPIKTFSRGEGCFILCETQYIELWLADRNTPILSGEILSLHFLVVRFRGGSTGTLCPYFNPSIEISIL